MKNFLREKNKLVKGASVLLITAFLVFSSIVVTADTNDQTIKVDNNTITEDVASTVGTSEGRGSFPILFEIPLPNAYSVGVGFDGTNFWVSAGDQQTGVCEFYVYDEYGTQLDNQPQGGGATGWGHRDMAWDGTDMFGSYSLNINGFSDIYTYDGYFVGPINPNRAMAYDGTYFYTCGFGTDLYQLDWDGVWGSTATATDLGGPWSGAYGLAYDSIFNCLWMTTADYSGNLYQLDMNGNLLNTYTTLPEYDIHGGCTMAPTRFGDVLVILVQSDPDKLVFYEVHPVPEASIDIEKQVLVGVNYPCMYTICLYDTVGDGWGTGYLNVSVNGITVLSYLTCPAAGPDCFVFQVVGGDLIEVYYWDPDPWPTENIYELLDCDGILVAQGVGESPDDPEPEIVYTTPMGNLIDADDPESAVDWEICTIVQFVITIHNDGDFPLFDIYIDDIMHDSLEIMDWDWQPSYLYYDPPYWYFGWYFPGPLNPCETITINIWAHVWGPHCSIDENYVSVDAFCPETQEFVFDEDSAFIHCRDTCHIDVEKYVWDPYGVASGDYTICLEDSYGDGWNGGVVDVYVNGELIYDDLTIQTGPGPECYPIPVMSGDVIETDYTPGDWPEENYYEIRDFDGNVVASAWGDDPDPDLTVDVPLGAWIDADTENEAIDLEVCTNATYMIAIHNDGMCVLEDIWAYDWFSESLEFVDANPYPTYIAAGYLEWTNMGWDLMPCEWIYIYITFHVLGPACENDDNLGAADAWCPCEGIYVYDEDYAWIHAIEGDTTPPVTTHELDGTMGENDWYISDVTITLTAEDDNSGVDYTMISIDGGAFEEYIAPVVVSDDGEHEFEYYSVDNAGNEEPVNGPFDFKIDQTPPTCDLTSEKISFNKWLFTADCDDATSGMDKVEFYLSIDGGDYTLEATVTSPPYEYEYTGLKNITVKAIAYDMAGLTSEDTAVSTTELVLEYIPFFIQTTEKRVL